MVFFLLYHKMWNIYHKICNMFFFTALYKDEEVSHAASYYAGIVAESPSVRNTQRYVMHNSLIKKHIYILY